MRLPFFSSVALSGQILSRVNPSMAWPGDRTRPLIEAMGTGPQMVLSRTSGSLSSRRASSGRRSSDSARAEPEGSRGRTKGFRFTVLGQIRGGLGKTVREESGLFSLCGDARVAGQVPDGGSDCLFGRRHQAKAGIQGDHDDRQDRQRNGFPGLLPEASPESRPSWRCRASHVSESDPSLYGPLKYTIKSISAKTVPGCSSIADIRKRSEWTIRSMCVAS